MLLRQDNSVTWLVSPFVLATLVCAMGALGLCVLWVVDHLVYHRLLNSIFLIGMRLEIEHRDIPPVRTLMAYSAHRKGGMSHWLKIFYTAPASALSVIAFAICLVSQNSGTLSSGAAITESAVPVWVCWPLAVLGLAAVVLIEVMSRRIPFRERADVFNDNEIFDMVNSGDFSAVLDRRGSRDQ